MHGYSFRALDVERLNLSQHHPDKARQSGRLDAPLPHPQASGGMITYVRAALGKPAGTLSGTSASGSRYRAEASGARLP
ncbi:hypothetical protein [Rhizobium mongolense]|uniref:hypothetical protein n=1 Tax=Rhizobium mongolense TaxID=57676 RepID=UPI00160C9548